VWIVVAFVTPPTDGDVLCRFYRAVRPSGPGWTRVRRDCHEPAEGESLADAFSGWVFGWVFVYCALFGTGHLLLGRPSAGAALIGVGLVSAVYLRRTLRVLWAR